MTCSTCGLTASTALETRPGIVFVAHTQKLTHPRRVVEWALCIKCELKERGSDAVVFGSKQNNR